MAELATLGRVQADPGVVRFVGRIRDSRKWASEYFLFVALPAPDEYTSPRVVEIRSSQSLGRVGDEIDVLCVCGGYVTFKEVTDHRTGEVSKKQFGHNTFTVLADSPAAKPRQFGAS